VALGIKRMPIYALDNADIVIALGKVWKRRNRR
jgi:hypothetical protein